MRDAANVLDYGRAGPARWRRLVRWAVVAVLLVTLAFSGLFALRNLSIWIARRQGYAAVAAWYQQARTCVIPAGTLLYTERPGDVVGAATRSSGTNLNGSPHVFATFDVAHPLLRQVGFDQHGVPRTFTFDVLYVHEHDFRAAPMGHSPRVICVRYNGLDAQGRPQFSTIAYGPIRPGAKPPMSFFGATTAADGAAGRSLADLRLFAGAPDPTDASRFAIPFDCDAGRGRFEFQTDTDVTDGGKFAPDVRLEWDDAATQPAGAADAVQR